MKTTTASRRATLAGLLSLPVAARTVAASPSNADAKSANHADLLAAREAVWRQWFAGDRKALLAILPENFVGIGAGDGGFRTREETIKDAEGFVAAGNKLTDLKLTDNHVQVLGNVSVIYCRFSFTITDKSGASSTTAGRATEMFVRTATGWQHPGWHLDSGR